MAGVFSPSFCVERMARTAATRSPQAGCLRQRDDQIRHLNQLDENLAHVIIQRDDLPLRQRAHLHAHRAGVNQHDHRRVDDHIGRRVHHRGDAADGKLHAGEELKLVLKLRALRVLLAEGANHANARQIFAGRRGYAVQLPLARGDTSGWSPA